MKVETKFEIGETVYFLDTCSIEWGVVSDIDISIGSTRYATSEMRAYVAPIKYQLYCDNDRIIFKKENELFREKSDAAIVLKNNLQSILAEVDNDI